MEAKSGIVTKVVWKADDSDRKIMLVRFEMPNGMADGRLIANVHSVSDGDWFIAHGDWRAETYKNKQSHIFAAKVFRPDLPASTDGAQEFLGRAFDSRHGVDLASIQQFVAVHGPQCCRTAEQNPEILLGLTKDPAKFRERILSDWGRRVSNRRAVVLMEGASVDRLAIGRILDAYRDATWDTLRNDPYLVSRVPGVGFGNADKIGDVLKIQKNDRRRLDAAFISLVDESKSQGSTMMSAADLMLAAESRFKFPPDLSKAWLKMVAARHDGALVVDKASAGYVVQLPELYRTEAFVAKAAIRQMTGGRRNNRHEAERHLSVLLNKPEFSRFDPVQRSAIINAASEPFSILTGGPGTGKTTVTKAIADTAEALGEKNIILAAPTGKAAKRMQEATGRSAQTIHRMLWAQEDRRTGASIFRINRGNPLAAGAFVIVDEASMLDVETMGAIFDAMPTDGRLLLVGDRNQLPSVGPGNMLTDMLGAGGGANIVPATELTTVYRQKGNSAIATGAVLIKDGKVPAMDNIVRGGLSMLENKTDRIVDRVSHLLRVGGFVRDKLGLDPRRDVAILCPQAPGSAGTWEINTRLSAELNPDGRTIEGVAHGADDDKRMPLPRVGDRVMMTQNDDENDVMNGDVGTIVDAVERDINGRTRRYIQIAFDCHADEGKIVEYPATRWRELILAYACTVHKSQGSQWPCVILPMTMAHENMLDRTLLYTGWTRAQDILLVVGESEAVEYAAKNLKSVDRNTRLREFVESFAAEAKLTRSAPQVVAIPVQPVAPANRPAMARPTGLPAIGRSLATAR